MSHLKIFVTGASTFIGQAFILEMLQNGHDVVAKDHAIIEPSKLSILADQYQLNLVLLNIDFHNQVDIFSHISECDCVVHFAHYWQAQSASMESVIHSTQALMKACAKAHIRKLIYVSSTTVYGDPPSSTVITEASPYLASIQPQISINQAEEKLISEGDVGDTEVIVLQLGRVYGAGEGGETANMLRQMSSTFILLAREGCGYCNPLYIDDAVAVINLACNVSNLHRQRFIISQEKPIQWKELLRGYQTILGEKSLICLPIDYDRQPSDPTIRASDLLSTVLKKGKVMQLTSAIAKVVYGKPIHYPSADEFRSLVAQPIFSGQKARDVLNFQPSVTLADGMKKIQAWWQSRSLDLRQL